MRKHFILLVLLVATALSAHAASLKATFGSGILGVPWGSSLTDVVGMYPQGDHVFAVTPGCRAYWVKDGQTFLGIRREGHGALFAFDKTNHVGSAVVAFDFERKDELRTMLTSLFGTPIFPAQSGGKFQYGWRSSDGMNATVTEFGEGTQRIVWLSVFAPGYTSAKDGC
jgi:hypothetical protein